jgi:hypothetical protein
MAIRIGHIEENYLVIVRSGAPEPGKWFEEKINLYQRRARQGSGHRADEQLGLDQQCRGRRLRRFCLVAVRTKTTVANCHQEI